MGKTHFPRVVIIGAGIAGQELVRELRRHRAPIRLMGFIDDDVGKQGKRYQRLRVLGRIEATGVLLKKHTVDEVYIAIPSAAGETIQGILDAIGDYPVRIRIVPRWLDIVQGNVHLSTIRPIRPEDLLGRPIVRDDQRSLHKVFRGRRVFITGGAGSIGSELVRQVLVFRPQHVIVYDWWENGLYMLQREIEHRFPRARLTVVLGSVQERQKLTTWMVATKPSMVFHAAAFKHVPTMESFPEEAVRNNIFATKNVLDAAVEVGVDRFVLLSTDKAVHPRSVMGQSKKIAERLVLQKRNLTTAVVRFGNVLESFGSILPLFRQQIAAGGPVTVTDPRMDRYFMTIPEAVQLILHAVRLMSGRDIFVFDMGKPVNILALTKRAIRLLGYIPGKEIKIRMTRPRVGEKMHEVLFTHEEAGERTEHAGIFRTALQERINVSTCLALLRNAVRQNDKRKIRAVLRRYA